MAEGTAPRPLVATSTRTTSGGIQIYKTNNIVTLSLIGGTITMDSEGVIYTLPIGLRPMHYIYFPITTSGTDTEYYLCQINPDNGNVKIYNRGASFNFMYGSVTYQIA